jgi:hypothetical protein
VGRLDLETGRISKVFGVCSEGIDAIVVSHHPRTQRSCRSEASSFRSGARCSSWSGRRRHGSYRCEPWAGTWPSPRRVRFWSKGIRSGIRRISRK